MRRLFTTAEALASGLTMEALRWGEARGRWRRVVRGVYADGPEETDELDVARARVLSARTAATGRVAGVLHEFDGVTLDGVVRRRRAPVPTAVVRIGGVPCTDAVQTLVDLAAELDDLVWEQALESALRGGLATVTELERLLPALGRARTNGTARMRRVLALRPAGAAPTGSILETLMVQLARTVPRLGTPIRQRVIYDAYGTFVARLDLAWPEIGLFIELDGQQHKGQPVYDAMRETAVVSVTGWLPGRFTWHEVVRLPRTTARRLDALAATAAARGSVVGEGDRLLGAAVDGDLELGPE